MHWWQVKRRDFTATSATTTTTTTEKCATFQKAADHHTLILTCKLMLFHSFDFKVKAQKQKKNKHPTSKSLEHIAYMHFIKKFLFPHYFCARWVMGGEGG